MADDLGDRCRRPEHRKESDGMRNSGDRVIVRKAMGVDGRADEGGKREMAKDSDIPIAT